MHPNDEKPSDEMPSSGSSIDAVGADIGVDSAFPSQSFDESQFVDSPETTFNVDEYMGEDIDPRLEMDSDSDSGSGLGSDDEGTLPPVAQLRIPPHSLEAESSVLGGVLLDNASWDKIGDLLTEEDFYRYEHRLIFGAIYSLMNSARAADTLTVFEHLKSQGKAEEAGNIEYLNSLAQYIPSESNIRRFAEIVRERAMLRKLLSVSEEITTSAMNTG